MKSSGSEKRREGRLHGALSACALLSAAHVEARGGLRSLDVALVPEREREQPPEPAAVVLAPRDVLAAASPVVEFYTGITVPAWQFTPQELLLVPALVAFATLVGFLPVLTAYRTDVAKTLGGAR